jgi:hypothetical protein
VQGIPEFLGNHKLAFAGEYGGAHACILLVLPVAVNFRH